MKPPSQRKKPVQTLELEMDPAVFQQLLKAYAASLQHAAQGDNNSNWQLPASFIIHIISRIADISSDMIPCRYENINNRMAFGIFCKFGEDLPLTNNAVEIGSIMDRLVHRQEPVGPPRRALPEAIKYVISNHPFLMPTRYSLSVLHAVFGPSRAQAHALLVRLALVVLEEMSYL